MTGGTTPSPPSDSIAEQAALWWHETDSALQAGQLVRARRFLRWILACCPEDVEAWLWIARLSPRLEERLAFLRRAYAQDKRWKLYADGSFYDLCSDPLEERPLSLDQMEREAAEAELKLREVQKRMR